jgi:hypothetical protein
MTRLLSILLLVLCGSAFGQNVTNLVAGQRVWAGMKLTTTFALGAPAYTNIVANPGFETGDLTGWSQGGITSGGVATTYAHSGSYSMFIYSGTPGSIWQSLTTTNGQTYQVSFWLSNCGADGEGLVALWGSTSLTNLTNSVLGSYYQFSFNESATTNLTTLRFDFYEGSCWTIDDVSVVQQ